MHNNPKNNGPIDCDSKRQEYIHLQIANQLNPYDYSRTDSHPTTY